MKMKKELSLKQPSNELKQLIDKAVRNINTSAGMVDQAFIKGRTEGFLDKQIGRMIRNHMSSLGYDPSTIRRALPPSAKDTTKTRKDYLYREQKDDKHDELDERTVPSYENRNESNVNQTSHHTTEESNSRIHNLEVLLKQEQDKYEDLSIRHDNLSHQATQFWNQLHNEGVRTLILAGEKFPPNSSQVFKSPDFVFVVEFKGTKILDISVMTQQQAHDQYMNEKQMAKGL